MDFEENLKKIYLEGENKILSYPKIEAFEVGQAPIAAVRTYFTQFYHIIRNFPLYLQLLYDRADDKKLKSWLRLNLIVESHHAEGWENVERAVGIEEDTIHNFKPLDKVEEWHQYLYKVNSDSLVPVPAAVCATNFVVEGVTGSLVRKVYNGWLSYDSKEGIKIDEKSKWWFDQHKEYDDKHPKEALEHIIRLANTSKIQNRCIEETAKSLEIFYKAIVAMDKD